MKKKLLFADHGLSVHFALKLSQYFEVFYWTPWNAQAFPHPNNAFIGDGFDEITRVKDFWSVWQDMDLFFFSDIYDGGLQEHLRSLGKPVFGSGRGDELEIFRWKMRQIWEGQKMPVNKAVRVNGIAALRKYLQEHENVFVKVSGYRGFCETFHSENYDLIKPRLDDLENDTPVSQVLPFIVEQPIDAVIELGYDGYAIDGQYPNKALFGVEVKDCGYLGAVKPYKQLPAEVRAVNEGLAPLFNAVNYRMFCSTEIRVAKDGTPYLIDFTGRLPSPPSELYQEMYGNLEEIISEGANGVLVQPKFIHQFGACATIYCPYAESHGNAIYFPEETRQWVKLHNHAKIEGVDTFLPFPGFGMPELGMCIGVGDTLLEAIKHCRKNALQISGFDTKVKCDSLVDGLAEIEKAEKYGIKFADKIPTVEEILND